MIQKTSDVITPISPAPQSLRLRRIGIDTYQEPVIYLRADSPVCRSEGFAAQSRLRVATRQHEIVATLNMVHSDLLTPGEAGLSEIAWQQLAARHDDLVALSHADTASSFRLVKAMLHGHRLDAEQYQCIASDIAANRYTDLQLSSFVTVCTRDDTTLDDAINLTRAMVKAGEQLHWDYPVIMDKHCVGGLPGNRTTPIVVAIVAAAGIPIPKTSSRAITSPAGTADTMETLAPVNLSLKRMRQVVEQELGCIVWGGSVALSPADDVLIRVQRALQIDNHLQLIASVLSKKIAAGATHVVIDIPVGPTVKVRSDIEARRLSDRMVSVGQQLGIQVAVVLSDGNQPVGRGIGPSLEARDILSVLQGSDKAPQDLLDRACRLAGEILEIANTAPAGLGQIHARKILQEGHAWKKFQAICEAQGGLREPLTARYTQPVTASRAGQVLSIDNRRLAKVAKLAGAPAAAAAGVLLHTRLHNQVMLGEPLFSIHAETPGELSYALHFLKNQPDIIGIGENP